MKIEECRGSVQDFAIQMEIKLRENDYKGGWGHLANEEIVARMLEETSELLMEMACIGGNNPCDEAIDVANFAMMFWDNNHRSIIYNQD